MGYVHLLLRIKRCNEIVAIIMKYIVFLLKLISTATSDYLEENPSKLIKTYDGEILFGVLANRKCIQFYMEVIGAADKSLITNEYVTGIWYKLYYIYIYTGGL